MARAMGLYGPWTSEAKAMAMVMPWHSDEQLIAMIRHVSLPWTCHERTTVPSSWIFHGISTVRSQLVRGMCNGLSHEKCHERVTVHPMARHPCMEYHGQAMAAL